MRKHIILVCSFVLTIASVCVAQQQTIDVNEFINVRFHLQNYLGMGALPARYEIRVLLLRPAIQNELKLSTDQIGRLKKVGEEATKPAVIIKDEFLEERAQLKANGDDDFNAKSINRFTERMTAFNQSVDKARMNILSPAQRVRLEQVRLQIEGPAAFLRPDLQDRLNIDPDGRVLIEQTFLQGIDEMSHATALPAALNDGELSSKERLALRKTDAYKSAVDSRRAAAVKHREAMTHKILRLLSKRQRDRYQSMLGEPFALDKLRTKDVTKPAPDSEEKKDQN